MPKSELKQTWSRNCYCIFSLHKTYVLCILFHMSFNYLLNFKRNKPLKLSVSSLFYPPSRAVKDESSEHSGLDGDNLNL